MKKLIFFFALAAFFAAQTTTINAQTTSGFERAEPSDPIPPTGYPAVQIMAVKSDTGPYYPALDSSPVAQFYTAFRMEDGTYIVAVITTGQDAWMRWLEANGYKDCFKRMVVGGKIVRGNDSYKTAPIPLPPSIQQQGTQQAPVPASTSGYKPKLELKMLWPKPQNPKRRD